MQLKKVILSIGCLMCWLFLHSQQIPPDAIFITGKVVDSLTQQPIELATISFKNQQKTVGTTSDKNGNFKMAISSGVYTIKVEFLSYISQQFVAKELLEDTDLGTILLPFNAEKLNEIEIVAQKDLVEFKIDRKIYNASKDIANKGGNAIDVLNNTPSVRVDDDGTVIVRGASATVLINGKPVFGLDRGTDILSSIPSNTIDKVEIITRSAKYSAEGGGGIINIITKKKKDNGFSGSFEAHLGSPDNNGGSTFLNKKTNKITIYSTLSFNNRERIQRTTIDQTFFDIANNTTGFFKETRKDENQRNSFLASLGSDFYINSKNTLTTSFLFNSNNKNYFSSLGLDNFDAGNTLERSAIRKVGDFDDITKIELFLNYTTKFDKKGHQLSFDFKYDNTVSENDASIVESISIPTTGVIDQKVIKDQHLDNFLFQLDYELPIDKNKKIELGYKGTLRFYDNTFDVSQFDEITSNFISIGGFNDIVQYDEKVHAFYGLFSASKGNLSYSAGLRTEISDVSIGENSSNNTITKKYTDLFPSATLGYEFNGGAYLSINYSRSINRPKIPQINPFISLNDERFQSVGNPDLNPYYTNYFELAYDKNFDKLTVISSVYLNFANNQFLTVIQNAGLNAEGLETFRRIPINSGDKNVIGVDIDLTYKPTKALRLGTYISPYNLDISNTLNNQYDFNSWVVYTSAYALISLNNGLRLKADYFYQSPIKNNLTKLRTINFVNVALSKSLFQKKGTLTFKVIDVFNSKWFSTQSSEANTQTFRRVRYDQQFNLSFTYNFKQKRRSSKDRSRDVNKDVLEDRQDEKF